MPQGLPCPSSFSPRVLEQTSRLIQDPRQESRASHFRPGTLQQLRVGLRRDDQESPQGLDSSPAPSQDSFLHCCSEVGEKGLPCVHRVGFSPVEGPGASRGGSSS